MKNKYFYMTKAEFCWLMCKSIVAITKKENVKQNFKMMHVKYETKYPRITKI